jgi:sugar lactone lactonase YvrE
MSFNDSKVDRQGRFITGLVDRALTDPATFELVGSIEPPAALYRVERALTVHHLTDGFGITNGPCFSPDGATLYCNDSWTRRIEAFDYDTTTGAASNRRTVAAFEDETSPGVSALPDGATVDAEGCIWVAAFYGGEIRRYGPDGSLDRRLEMPVASPTSVAFGGPDLDVLYVTSMGDAGLPGDVVAAGPLAGTILAVHGLGVHGVGETRFAG